MEVEFIEIGPHFLTFYSKQYTEMIEASTKLYPLFCETFPKLADCQQQDFKHETNDPNVYHPYGEPNEFRKAFRHFHVRYIYEPGQEDIDNIIPLVKKAGANIDNHQVIKLEDNKLSEYEHLQYPHMDSGETYLDYIDRLRTGEWRQK